MELKNVLILSALGFGAVMLLQNRQRNTARRVDEITDDLSDDDTRIALDLQQIMSPYEVVGFGWTTRVNKSEYDKAADILNTLLRVTNWTKVKNDFRNLCNGVYTLNEALQSSLNTDNYNLALNVASAKKVITTQDTAAIYITDDNKTYQRYYAANTLLGAFKQSTDNSIVTYAGFDGEDNLFSDDEMKINSITVSKDRVKLV